MLSFGKKTERIYQYFMVLNIIKRREKQTSNNHGDKKYVYFKTSRTPNLIYSYSRVFFTLT